MDRELLTWEALEHRHRPHGPDWFWAIGVIGLGISVTAIVLGNLLFGILVIIGTVALLLQSLKHPREIEFGITERGIRIGTTLYPYTTLEVFWITEDDLLLIRSTKVFMPLLIIPIEGPAREEVRDALLGFLDEEELHEPLSHKIMEAVGF
jgi:hypothetical protein